MAFSLSLSHFKRYARTHTRVRGIISCARARYVLEKEREREREREREGRGGETERFNKGLTGSLPLLFIGYVGTSLPSRRARKRRRRRKGDRELEVSVSLSLSLSRALAPHSFYLHIVQLRPFPPFTLSSSSFISHRRDS